MRSAPTCERTPKAQAGWDAAGRFDFAERLIDPVRDAGTFGRGRCARATSLLEPKSGRLELADLVAVLRDHGAEAEGDPDWTPRKTERRSICMHAACGARRSQTVNSMASDLTPGAVTHWVTGTSAPCLSLFKPVVIGLPMRTSARPSTCSTTRACGGATKVCTARPWPTSLPALALISGERDALEAGFPRPDGGGMV